MVISEVIDSAEQVTDKLLKRYQTIGDRSERQRFYNVTDNARYKLDIKFP